MADIEKLGYFYLGRRHDPATGQTLDEPLLYDSRDLTTHAVCVGMTGSGKTGLCVSLLEEAAIDGIPALIIDPKGDLGNLLLTFPNLDGASFRPWIDEAAADRNGVDLDDEANRIAKTWREGLAKWGQDGSRIARLRAAVDSTIYTPGSSAGRRLSILGSLSAPDEAIRANAEALADRIETAASSLLALLGIAADPLRSREHVLLSTIFETAWKTGTAVSIEELVRQVQRPPFERVGALALESFYPEKDRFDLAISLNNFVASPGFAFWGEGEPLEIDDLLHTADGKPRLSIISVAHLDERERMFVVTLILNEFVAWVRRQPGSQSLRAILYMDEVFGYLPPTANPSSKKPLLTLLKQARAHGVGVVLATQNPVDLDYKALSNAGTWFLGRLQTARDKARLLDGLDSLTSKGLSRSELDALLSSVGKRVFLMHDVHEDSPVVFHSRWALSYLAGPLSRDQIARLAGPTSTQANDTKQPSAPPATQTGVSFAEESTLTRPVVEPGIAERFAVPARHERDSEVVRYRPALVTSARLHFVHTRAKLDTWTEVTTIGDVDDRDPAWREVPGSDIPPMQDEAPGGASFLALPECGARAASYKRWTKHASSWLHQVCKLQIWYAPRTKTWSEAGESKGQFVARTRMLLREQRDHEIDRIRERYATKVATLVERIRRAEQKVEREREQYESARGQAAISFGATVLAAIFGRKLGSSTTLGRATTTMRGAGRAAQQKTDIDRARDDVDALREQLATLEQEVESETSRIASEYDERQDDIETVDVAPRKSDITVERLTLAWIPAAREE